MQSQWKHFKAEWERLSLADRILLILLLVTLLTAWLVPRPQVLGYKWKLPPHRPITYYMK
jgi:hypothetical protein